MAHSPFDTALDRESDVPLGTQLAWRLRAAVATGGLAPGDRLPPVRELAAAAGVNVNTVRSVYARLAEQGVVVSEQGRGTFVARGGDARADGGLADLAERAGRDARRRGVDPRDLAAVLYARHDQPAGEGEGLRAGAEARAAVRSEIAALEHELALLDPAPAELRSDGPPAGMHGARLVAVEELEATRDQLAARLVARRSEVRAARAQAASRAQGERAAAPERGASSGRRAIEWPELLASGWSPALPQDG